MAYRWNRIAQLSAIGASCSLAVWITSTSAKDETTSVLVKKPAAASSEGPILPPPAKPAKEITSPKQPQPPQPPVKPVSPQPPKSHAVKRPFMQPAQPREPAGGKLAAEGELPPPAGAVVERPPVVADTVVDIRPTPPIKYDTDGDARRLYRTGEVNIVMVTQNPADSCYYEIPLCIPACCTGDPVIKSGRGILGRGVVEYCWSNGFRAIVKFRQVRGDVRVDYEGD